MTSRLAGAPWATEVQRQMAAVRDFDPANVLVDASGLHLTVKPPLANGSVPSGGVFTVKSAMASEFLRALPLNSSNE